jgi:hypothetical protein
MDIIKTGDNGTTLEFGDDSHGNQVHKVCSADKSHCQWVEPWHCADCYFNALEAAATPTDTTTTPSS